MKNNNLKKQVQTRRTTDNKMERNYTNGHKEFENECNFMKKSLVKVCIKELKILCE